MNRTLLTSTLFLSLVISGCSVARSRRMTRSQPTGSGTNRVAADENSLNSSTKADISQSVANQAGRTRVVSHQQVDAIPTEPTESRLRSVVPVEAGGPSALTLVDWEGMALTHNPTLVQATAQVEAARGAAYQAGLYPNPVVGYTGEQIGVNGTAGETQGGFIAQEFVTGGKLRLSRAKWQQRVEIAQTNLHAQQQRVLNDVRSQFYRTLAAQHLVAIHQEILANGEDNLQTHREMLNLGQTNQVGFLKAEIDLQRDRLNLTQAENEFQHAWRSLIALAGVPELCPTPLAGTLEPVNEPLDWESALSNVLSTSPELRAAWQKIRHDEITVDRERVEPIPNLLADVTVGRNFEALDTTTTVNLGVPLPIFDRNQGTIRQAQSDLSRSHAEARRLELALNTQLALRFRDYLTSWQRVQAYQSEMLPKAKNAYDLLHESYKARRAPWPDVLMAQRMYLDLQTQYIDNVLTYRENEVSIRGMLLTGGLSEPPAPISGGHIDAIPKPR